MHLRPSIHRRRLRRLLLCTHRSDKVRTRAARLPPHAVPTIAPAIACRTGVGFKHTDSTGQRVSSWGGSVLYDADDGKYHMWAAEMSENTGIKAWETNSRVVHAVADGPSSASAASSSAMPFEFVRKEEVWPVFAHEPTVSRAPTGEYVVRTAPTRAVDRRPGHSMRAHAVLGARRRCTTRPTTMRSPARSVRRRARAASTARRASSA